MVVNQLKTNLPLILLISILVIFVSVAGAEAKSSKYTVTAKFTEYCCGYGKQGQKVTVSVVNFETGEKLGKKTFNFKDVLKHSSKVSMGFDRKDSRTGDRVDVKGDAGPPSGGSDTVFFTFDVKKHNYNVVIALDEVGCGLSGHTCD